MKYHSKKTVSLLNWIKKKCVARLVPIISVFALRSQIVNTLEEVTLIRKPKGYGKRHIQVFLIFLGYALAYSHKVNLSVGIVAMETESEDSNQTTFNWSESTRGIILSSVFWGYLITPIPAGIISHQYGAKIPIFFAIFISSLATLLTPWAARLGWHYLCFSRFIIGMMQGSICPCVHTLLSNWVHPIERSFLSSIAYSGSKVGIISTMMFSGWIASSRFGWPGIFYFSGFFSLLWTILWLIYGSNSPEEYDGITIEEKDFIQSSVGIRKAEQPIPWSDIMTSPAFLCLIIVHAASSWGYFLLLTEMPSYISGILDVDIKSNAMYTAVPYIVMLILLIFLSQLSDNLLEMNLFSVEFGRKLFNTIGMWIPMICFILLGYTQHDTFYTILLLSLAVGLNAGIYVGFFINFMDLSPNFAGTMIGITSAAANIMSICAPIFVGAIVYDKNDAALWKNVFLVSAEIYFIGNLVYIIFGKACVQKWNNTTQVISISKLV